MTDRQFLTALRIRASKRIGNFGFITILDELLTQARDVGGMLEQDVMDRLALVARLYTTLDDDDIQHLKSNQQRKLVLEDQERIARLHKTGFYIGRNMEDDRRRLQS
jgi:hypothetical protein